ncbi:MAG TPA: hypothetical protein VGI19_08625 [Candidatus Cybelea sp.]
MRLVTLALVLLYALAQAGSPSISQLPPSWFDPFCSVSVQAMPWDVKSNAPANEPADGLAAVLSSQNAAKLDAHVTLIGDTNAYDAFFGHVSLSGKPPALRSRTYLVQVPKAEAIRYAFVDSYAAAGAASTICASEPVAIGTWQSSAPHPQRPNPADRVTAVFSQAIPPLKCGKVYQPPTLAGESLPSASGVDKPRTSWVMAFVNAKGDVVKTYVWQSSGIDSLDTAASVAAQRSRFTPGTLLCTPIPASYLFRADFKP